MRHVLRHRRYLPYLPRFSLGQLDSCCSKTREMSFFLAQYHALFHFLVAEHFLFTLLYQLHFYLALGDIYCRLSRNSSHDAFVRTIFCFGVRAMQTRPWRDAANPRLLFWPCLCTLVAEWASPIHRQSWTSRPWYRPAPTRWRTLLIPP